MELRWAVFVLFCEINEDKLEHKPLAVAYRLYVTASMIHAILNMQNATPSPATVRTTAFAYCPDFRPDGRSKWGRIQCITTGTDITYLMASNTDLSTVDLVRRVAGCGGYPAVTDRDHSTSLRSFFVSHFVPIATEGAADPQNKTLGLI